MIPRSYSNGASQPRRTKSAPSVQRRTSASSLINPVAAKQHAIVAATIAYERSHAKGCGDELHVEKLARRKSNRVRRPEGQGSHFEASHAPRHQSSKKLSTTASSANDNARSRRATVNSIDTAPTYNTNRHQRSVDVVEYSKGQILEASRGDQAFSQHIRKSKSMYATSGSAPATSIDAISFASTPTSKVACVPLARQPEETLTSIIEQDNTLDSAAPLLAPIALSNSAIYRVDERLNKARDHHLQQFQLNKLRHRASTMLTPFKKRIGSFSSSETAPLSGTSNNGVTYAGGQCSPAKEYQQQQRDVTGERRAYKSFKDKIKKAFRRPSGIHIGLPVQQVHASRAHFGDLLSASSSRLSTIRGKSFIKSRQISGTAPNQYFPQRPVRSNSEKFARASSPTASEATVAMSTSRVTSWADSTMAGTTTSQDSHGLTIIHEDQPLPEAASLCFQKRVQPLELFRRRPKSTAIEVVNHFPESTAPGGYRIESSGSESALKPRSQIRQTAPNIATLPSQMKWASLQVSRTTTSARTVNTVRVVSSSSSSVDSSDSTIEINASRSPSIIPPLRLEDITSQNQSLAPVDNIASNSSTSKREQNRIQKLHKEQLPDSVAPSAGQVASRLEKMNRRLKESLDEGRSLFYPRSQQNEFEDVDQGSENTEKSTNSTPASGEVILQPVREPQLDRSLGVASPSIYSRNTNSASPQRMYRSDTVSLKSTSSNEKGTAVIITSHPVVRYTVGSETKSVFHLAKTSRDWRVWISKEVEELGTPPPENLTLSDDYVPTSVDSRHHREHAQIVDGETLSIGSDILASIEQKADLLSGTYPTLGTISMRQTPIDDLQSHTSIRDSAEPLPESPAGMQTKLRPQLRKTTSRYGPDDRPSSRLHDRPTLRNRSASCMNERFPLIDTGRPLSRQRKASTPPGSEHVKDAEKNKHNERERMELTPQSVAPNHLRVPMFIAQPSRAALRRPQSTNSFQRSKSSLAHYTTSGAENSTPKSSPSRTLSHIPRPTRSTTPMHRPKSTLETVAASRRNHIAPASASNIDTDPTLAAIFQGPYHDSVASPKSLSIRKPASFYKENSPFSTLSPERTISEDDVSTMHATPTSGGQRLAEQFLTARRLRTEMRMIESPSSVGSPMFL